MTARFVGGTGRCGTALLGSVFTAHPEVTYFREPRFISDPDGLCDYLWGEISLDRFKDMMLRRFRRNLVAKLAMVETGPVHEIYSEDVIGALLNETMDDEDQFADGRRFVEGLFALMGRPYWVEKTPHTVMHVDLLHRMFPEMRYLHMIREPKDVYASLLHQHWGPKSVSGFIVWYSRIMRQARRAYDEVPGENYKVVSLEALVCNPLTVLQSILEFMEIPFDVDWLSQAVTIDPGKGHVGRHEKEITMKDGRTIDMGCRELYLFWKGVENE